MEAMGDKTRSSHEVLIQCENALLSSAEALPSIVYSHVCHLVDFFSAFPSTQLITTTNCQSVE